MGSYLAIDDELESGRIGCSSLQAAKGARRRRAKIAAKAG